MDALLNQLFTLRCTAGSRVTEARSCLLIQVDPQKKSRLYALRARSKSVRQNSWDLCIGVEDAARVDPSGIREQYPFNTGLVCLEPI